MNQSTGVDVDRTAAAASEQRRSRFVAAFGLSKVYEIRELGIILALLALIIVFTAANHGFLTKYNLLNIAVQASVTAILAIAETFVIITAGIDLSVGSVLAVSAVVAGLAMVHGVPIPIALLFSLAIGALAGLANGLISTVARITPFIVTLGTMSIYSGLALIFSGGQTVYGIPQDYDNLLGGSIASIPIPVIVLLVVLILSALALAYTKFGEYAVAIGGNKEVARLSGINVLAYTTATYVVAGVLAALGGTLTVARLGSADPTLGGDLLLPAIAAAVMGGADLMGGEGSMVGAVVGALLIATLQAGLTLMNVQAFYQQVAVGAVIILALLFNRLQNR